MIRSLQSQPLNFDQLKHMVGPQNSKKINWLIYDELQKYHSLQDVLKNGVAVVLLQIESAKAPSVGHFVVLLDHGNHVEHFDSYGLTVDQENAITHERHLTTLFKQSPKPIVENTKRLQRFREDVQTCGRWVVARVLLRQLELKEFIRILQNISAPNDEMVTLMTMLLPLKQ